MTEKRILYSGNAGIVGEISYFSTNQAPIGWLICNGQNISKNNYKELYNLIGTKYGGDRDNFTLPNLITKYNYIRTLDSGANVDTQPNRILGSVQGHGIIDHTHLGYFPFNQAYKANDTHYHNHTIPARERGAGEQGDIPDNSRPGRGPDSNYKSTGYTSSETAPAHSVTQTVHTDYHTSGSTELKNIELLPCIKY